jgi:hypothetical protein
MVGQDTVTATPGARAGVDERSAVGEIGAWGKGYVRAHPLQSLETVGGQTMLGVRTVQYFFVDLCTGRFQFAEFVRQAAFMAGTSVVPTLLVTIPWATITDQISPEFTPSRVVEDVDIAQAQRRTDRPASGTSRGIDSHLADPSVRYRHMTTERTEPSADTVAAQRPKSRRPR